MSDLSLQEARAPLTPAEACGKVFKQLATARAAGVDVQAQVTAVERAAVNLKGHVDNLRDLVLSGKRPAHELEAQAAWLPAIEAAAATMREFAAHGVIP